MTPAGYNSMLQYLMAGAPDIPSTYCWPSDWLLIHKYVVDTTLTEILHERNEFSNLRKFFHQ